MRYNLPLNTQTLCQFSKWQCLNTACKDLFHYTENLKETFLKEHTVFEPFKTQIVENNHFLDINIFMNLFHLEPEKMKANIDHLFKIDFQEENFIEKGYHSFMLMVTLQKYLYDNDFISKSHAVFYAILTFYDLVKNEFGYHDKLHETMEKKRLEAMEKNIL